MSAELLVEQTVDRLFDSAVMIVAADGRLSVDDRVATIAYMAGEGPEPEWLTGARAASGEDDQ